MRNNAHPLPRPPRRRRYRVLMGLMAGVAVLLLSACGGSSSSGAGTTSAAKTTGQPGSAASRSAALRECLKKAGITLPSAPSGNPGNGAPPSGGAGGFKPPEGGSGSKFQEAIKKCGGGGFPAGGRGNINSASAKAALTKYESCMRENGVDLPAANTSGTGPVFSTKGIDTSSQSFKSAQKTCQGDLKGAFGTGSPPSGAAPPGGGEGAAPGGAGPPSGTEQSEG